MNGIEIRTIENATAIGQWANYLKFAVALKACSSDRFLLQWPNTTEVAAMQQAVSDHIRDEGMCPPKVHCPLVIKTSISPGIAYTYRGKRYVQGGRH